MTFGLSWSLSLSGTFLPKVVEMEDSTKRRALPSYFATFVILMLSSKRRVRMLSGY